MNTIPFALSYDDVLIVPRRSSVLPTDTDLSTLLSRRVRLNIPIVSAAMDTVTEYKMAIAIGKFGGIGIIHKNMSAENQAREVRRAKSKKVVVGAAVSVGDEQFERALILALAGADVLVVDAAHGHSDGVLQMVQRLKKNQKTRNMDIIAGNVATSEGAYDLAKAGADAIKVGMGPGSICITRIVAGIGIPQITAIMEAVKGVKRAKSFIPVIADGGIKYSGDIAKALAAGASCVMLGNLLAGTDESPGEIVEENGVKYKKYRGMGSLEAMPNGSKDRYGQKGVATSKLVAEGVSGRVSYKGNVSEVVFQLVGGVRASFGYLGARDIREFQKKARFIQISAAGMAESHIHSLGTF